MVIKGKIIKGLGWAKKTVSYQKPFFKQKGLPGVDRLKDGTINIDIRPVKYKRLNFDYFFKKIANGLGELEDFGFIKIGKIIYNNKEFKNPGYIYIPHKSPHFKNKNQLEIIAIEIPGLKMDNEIELEIDEEKNGNVKVKF
jgi:CTP-dependent riboflavin kinase